MRTTATLPRRCRQSKYLGDPEVLLMTRVQAGDDRAFAELVERYRARVFGSFVKRLGDRQEAEDLTQEVFLRLYRSRHTYQPRARFATWLFHVSQNVARNALRSRRLERSELAGVVRSAVSSLADRQRAAVELHQFHDRTYAEVAAELEMTP